MKTGMVFGVISILATLPAMADKCPNLRGRYECPARNGSPAYQMTVTQNGGLRRVVTYRWTYSSGTTEQYSASQHTVENEDGFFGICRNKGLYLSLNAADLSDAHRIEVNSKGSYVVTTFMNEPVFTCTRLKRRRD